MDSLNGPLCSRLPLCSHLLQQFLRILCKDPQQWVYAVFWRILPRNFPPPKWEIGGYLDRSKANKRNWILVWEDGFCDFSRGLPGLQPDLFFKMSHEIYNYGEGLMGKVSADNGHKWVYKDPIKSQHDKVNLACSWQNSIDSQPRTWEAQFKSGIQTISVIAVHEGLVQLGSMHEVQEDFEFILQLRSRFNNLQLSGYLNGALLSSPTSPVASLLSPADVKPAQQQGQSLEAGYEPAVKRSLERGFSWNGTSRNNHQEMLEHVSPSSVIPSMSSLEALLSKLPSVVATPSVTNSHSLNTSHPHSLESLSNSHSSHISSNPVQAPTSNPSPLIRSMSAPYGNDYWPQMSPATNSTTQNNTPTNIMSSTTIHTAGSSANTTSCNARPMNVLPSTCPISGGSLLSASDGGLSYMGDLIGG